MDWEQRYRQQRRNHRKAYIALQRAHQGRVNQVTILLAEIISLRQDRYDLSKQGMSYRSGLIKGREEEKHKWHMRVKTAVVFTVTFFLVKSFLL